MSKTYLIGNWKMNQTQNNIHEFFAGMAPSTLPQNVECWIAPQFVHIPYAIGLADDNTIKVGAQNCSEHDSGAFTGEVSAGSLDDIDTHFVIVGHSERRQYFKESDQTINTKVKKAINNNLVAVLCVGETLEEKEAGKTSDVVLSQLKKGLVDISISSADQLIIAYEPVWAIGTGKTATPEQAEEVHSQIRGALRESLPKFGDEMSILYGGSVKPNNIKELMSMPNINGGLVGGASLLAGDFRQLAEGASA